MQVAGADAATAAVERHDAIGPDVPRSQILGHSGISITAQRPR
jgi:hypothetical protein